MDSVKTYSSFTSMEKQRLIDNKTGKREWISARHVLAIMGFLGFLNVFTMRINLSISLVAMVNGSEASHDRISDESEECVGNEGFNSTKTPQKTGEFDWDEIIQGHILGSFFYGYLVTNLLSCWMLPRFGAKNVFGMGVLCTSVLTMLTPVAARYNVYLFIALRVLIGLGEGGTYPAMQGMWGVWAPEWERSQLTAFSFSGNLLGTAVTMPIAGYLCDGDFLGGWPSSFYVFGAIGCVWFIAWGLLIHETPAQHPRISEEEKKYIQSTAGKPIISPIPWKAILTSPQVFSLCLAQHCGQWILFMMQTCLPTYLKTIQKFDIKSNGLLSALPYISLLIGINLVAPFADYLIAKGYMSTTMTRKVLNTVGQLVPAIFLIACGYAGCDKVLVITLLTLSMGFLSGIFGGEIINALDFAPALSGVIMGITNAFAITSGFIAPMLVGYLTNNNQTSGQWRIIFYINGAISLLGCIVFNVFATGDELPWARIHEATQNGGDIIGKDENKVTGETKNVEAFNENRNT